MRFRKSDSICIGLGSGGSDLMTIPNENGFIVSLGFWVTKSGDCQQALLLGQLCSLLQGPSLHGSEVAGFIVPSPHCRDVECNCFLSK